MHGLARTQHDHGATRIGDAYLATRAAWLYYNCHLRQADVARELGLSLNRTNRLLALAQENGTVRVTVEGPIAGCVVLEDELRASYDLRHVRVVPDRQDDPWGFDALGRATASLLERVIADGRHRVFGIGHGRSLAAASTHMPQVDAPDAEFLGLFGRLPYCPRGRSSNLVPVLGDRTGGKVREIPAPLYARSAADRAVLLRQPTIGPVLERAGQAEFVLLGVGCPAETSVPVGMFGLLSEAEVARLRGDGAVACLMGHMLDARGRLLPTPLNRCVVAPPLEALRGREVVVVGGGNGRVPALLATLRTGLLRGLVTTELAARRLLKSR